MSSPSEQDAPGPPPRNLEFFQALGLWLAHARQFNRVARDYMPRQAEPAEAFGTPANPPDLFAGLIWSWAAFASASHRRIGRVRDATSTFEVVEVRGLMRWHHRILGDLLTRWRWSYCLEILTGEEERIPSLRADLEPALSPPSWRDDPGERRWITGDELATLEEIALRVEASRDRWRKSPEVTAYYEARTREQVEHAAAESERVTRAFEEALEADAAAAEAAARAKRASKGTIPERDAWIRQRRLDGWTCGEIHLELEEVAAARGWRVVTYRRVCDIAGGIAKASGTSYEVPRKFTDSERPNPE